MHFNPIYIGYSQACRRLLRSLNSSNFTISLKILICLPCWFVVCCCCSHLIDNEQYQILFDRFRNVYCFRSQSELSKVRSRIIALSKHCSNCKRINKFHMQPFTREEKCSILARRLNRNTQRTYEKDGREALSLFSLSARFQLLQIQTCANERAKQRFPHIDNADTHVWPLYMVQFTRDMSKFHMQTHTHTQCHNTFKLFTLPEMMVFRWRWKHNLNTVNVCDSPVFVPNILLSIEDIVQAKKIHSSSSVYVFLLISVVNSSLSLDKASRMRLTNVLLRHNIGWHTKMKWKSQKHRTIQDYGQVERLRAAGINVINGVDAFMAPKPKPAIP